MSVGAGLQMHDVVVKKFKFAISSPDEFLYILTVRTLQVVNLNWRQQSEERMELFCLVGLPGSFSFSAQTLHNTSSKPVAATSIVEFIQQAMIESHRCSAAQPVFSLQPRPPSLNAIPVRLLYPVSRFTRNPAEQYYNAYSLLPDELAASHRLFRNRVIIGTVNE